MASNERAKR
ncbi:unnamed protein product, partial [Rotaria magnacalcarata]